MVNCVREVGIMTEIWIQVDIPVTNNLEPQERMRVFDANEGFLLGNLVVGKPATFVILNKNPAADFEVLLEMKSYLIFSVKEGELLTNDLEEDLDAAVSRDAGQGQSGGSSYHPPPTALPSSSGYADKLTTYDSKLTTGVFTGVVALDSQHWGSQDSESKAQVGDLRTFDGSEVRGFEVGVDGTLKFDTPWTYKLFVADNTFDSGYDSTEGSNVTIRDLIVAVPLTEQSSITIGKKKEPISLERITGLLHLPSQERSAAADAMLPSRNIGVNLNGWGFDDRMTWSGGVFNNWLDDGGSMSSNSTDLIGRVTWLPFVSEDGNQRLHLGSGARHTNAKESLRFHSKPEFKQAPVFVDTGTLQAENVMTYALESYWQSGPFMLGGEYILTNIDAPLLSSKPAPPPRYADLERGPGAAAAAAAAAAAVAAAAEALPTYDEFTRRPASTTDAGATSA